MKIKIGRLLAFSLIMLSLIAISASVSNFARAVEDAPAITILADGTVNPSTAPIIRAENTYTLTADITNYYLHIQCSNITVDGAGYTVSISGMTYQSNHGIFIDGDYAVVKNFTVLSFGLGIMVNSSYCIVENNTVSRCVGAMSLQEGASHNTIKGNDLRNNAYANIYLNSNCNYNTITQNRLIAMYVEGSNNIISENTLDYFVKGGENNTYLNNTLDAYDNPTTTPTVPEFSWLTILPILLAIPIVLVIIRKTVSRNITL